ncbi:hypothetical protein SRHO_G00131190 [Serrasalmus rhombeus]
MVPAQLLWIIPCTVSGALSAVTIKDVKLGGSITLPCKLLEDTSVKQLELRWMLGEHLVIRLNQDQIIYGINYRNRTKLPTLGKSLLLEAGFGSNLLLPLHTVSPVIVSFLPDGGDSSVRVCEVEKEQVECGAAYSHRIDLQQHSLELTKLSMEDSGTFSVMERETQYTVSVLFIQVLPPSTGPPEEDERGGKTIIIITVIAVVIVVVIAVIVVIDLRRWRQRQLNRAEIQEAEVRL